ncbi:hypothetical protein [Actinophytocola glycyrrhizae]|uniref:HEAT repeat domain-containing protein n=1 Tax=Actinophytocola glycyrrhizae TaxID=2044873 RepID=A0ABV9S5E3_9PSEU
MSNCDELRSVLYDSALSNSERMVRIQQMSGIEGCVADAIVVATEEQDWATFEVYLRAAVHHPSSAITASLCAALSLKAPEVPNEDTLEVLGEVADPASLDCLREILYWDPEWDEYHHLNVKALSAIHKVGTAEAWGLIAAATDHPAAAVADRARTMVDRR